MARTFCVKSPAAGRVRRRGGWGIATAGSAVLLGLLSACGTSSVATDAPPAAAEDVDPELAGLLPADIAERGTLRVVLDPSNPPMESLSADQKTVVGIDPDLMNEIARRLGLTVEWESSNLGTIIASLQAHRYDLSIAAMSDTPERREAVDFVHYFQSPGGVMVRDDDEELVNADDLLELCGVKTGVVAGSAQIPRAHAASEDCVDNGLPPLELSEFPNLSAQNIALESDRVRAALIDKIAGAEMVKETAGGLAVTPIVYEIGGPAGIVFPKDTPQVRDAVQASLQSMMDDGTYQEILESWGPAVGEAGLPEATIGTSG